MSNATHPNSSDTSEDRLLDHRYDGIQEYDNPLPRWWVAIFWVTIVFSPLYILHYHFGAGSLEIESYDSEMIAFFDRQAQELLALGEVTDETIDDLMTNESMISGAKKIYQARCATCHGVFAEGGIGPNLTDGNWIHGGNPTDIYQTISEGVPEKGMLSWKRQLRPAELLGMAAYVGTLQGTDPPDAKAPEGVPFTRTVPDVEADLSEDAPTESTES
ncbi:MAG: c-type cytochrome [bacterium]|nr:c-type cytochrome [bacterium]